jgi:DNA primase
MKVAESLHLVNSFAQSFFTHTLNETAEGEDIGLSYLKERGFRSDTINKFQLGYSPANSTAFAADAIKAQYSTELLIRSGLVSERSGKISDNYRGRVIFPIHNQSGKIIGFGARTLKRDEKPKYINTPENEIYNKSKSLYGYYFARQAISKADECFLVEGFTDVIALHQTGIENVVASGGTSLTEMQLRLIKRCTNSLTIIYDGDQAGIKAAMRGIDLALSEGLNVKLVMIPDGQDPDEYLNAVGPARFKTFVQENSVDVVVFKAKALMQYCGNDPAKKAKVVQSIAETIGLLNTVSEFVRRNEYIKQCAQLLSIDEAGLTRLVNSITNANGGPPPSVPAIEHTDNEFYALHKDELQEREIARIMIDHGDRHYKDGETIVSYVLSELVDDSLFDCAAVLKIINECRNGCRSREHFTYHADHDISVLAVSLLSVPYDVSQYWEASVNGSYQKNLFAGPYENFMQRIARGNDRQLSEFLTAREDNTPHQVQSALKYLKLRKIKRMIDENQRDMQTEKDHNNMLILLKTHQHLKQIELQTTKD